MRPEGRRRGSPRAALALAAALLAPAAGLAQGNRIVLRVNDQIATLYDYQQRYEQRLTQIRRSDLPAAERQELLEGAARHVMQEILEELLVVSRAAQLGLEPSRDELAGQVERARQSFGITSDEQFRSALAQSGMTEPEFREQMRRNLLIRMVVGREVQARVSLEDDELRRLYQERKSEFQVPEQLELKEIVALESAGSDPASLARLATDLRARLLAGEPAAAVAAETAAAGRTTQVMDLGWVDAAELDPALASALAEVGIGEWSLPVAARGGMHLVQVLARREPRLLPFEEVSERIAARERDRRLEEELQSYLQELLDGAYVRSEPPPEAAGFLARIAPAEPDPLGGPVGTGVSLPEDPAAPGGPPQGGAGR